MENQYKFRNELGADKKVGIVIVDEVTLHQAHPAFEQYLQQTLVLRKQELTSAEENVRQDVRKMLRNGQYKPTGRGKPASEYLIRSVQEDSFPRINLPVDIINAVSLRALLPISVWDRDLAKTYEYVFRLGKPGESYIFNSVGQVIELQDLICGVGIVAGGEQAMVTPVKDSLATKTTEHTKNIVIAVYSPASFTGLSKVLDDLQRLFAPIAKHSKISVII